MGNAHSKKKKKKKKRVIWVQGAGTNVVNGFYTETVAASDIYIMVKEDAFHQPITHIIQQQLPQHNQFLDPNKPIWTISHKNSTRTFVQYYKESGDFMDEHERSVSAYPRNQLKFVLLHKVSSLQHPENLENPKNPEKSKNTKNTKKPENPEPAKLPPS